MILHIFYCFGRAWNFVDESGRLILLEHIEHDEFLQIVEYLGE